MSEASPRTAEIGITVSHLYQKQGAASEVLAGMLNWLCNEAGIKMIEAVIDSDNQASIRLVKSLGFKRSAKGPAHTWKNKPPQQLARYIIKR